MSVVKLLCLTQNANENYLQHMGNIITHRMVKYRITVYFTCYDRLKIYVNT